MKIIVHINTGALARRKDIVALDLIDYLEDGPVDGSVSVSFEED